MRYSTSLAGASEAVGVAWFWSTRQGCQEFKFLRTDGLVVISDSLHFAFVHAPTTVEVPRILVGLLGLHPVHLSVTKQNMALIL